jgi:hypothetical protein
VLYLNKVKLVTKEGCKCVLGALMHAPSVKGDCNVLPDKPSCASGHFGVEFFFYGRELLLPDAFCNCNLPTKTGERTARKFCPRYKGSYRTEPLRFWSRHASKISGDAHPVEPRGREMMRRRRDADAPGGSAGAGGDPPPSRRRGRGSAVAKGGMERDAPPRFRVGRPVTWTERGRASEQIARAARVVAGVATPCRSGSVLRFRQANRPNFLYFSPSSEKNSCLDLKKF